MICSIGCVCFQAFVRPSFRFFFCPFLGLRFACKKQPGMIVSISFSVILVHKLNHTAIQGNILRPNATPQGFKVAHLVRVEFVISSTHPADDFSIIVNDVVGPVRSCFRPLSGIKVFYWALQNLHLAFLKNRVCRAKPKFLLKKELNLSKMVSHPHSALCGADLKSEKRLCDYFIITLLYCLKSQTHGLSVFSLFFLSQ